MNRAELIEKTIEFVKHQFQQNDASHDFSHIERVTNIALKLAIEEGISEQTQLEIIKLAALMHDLADWKYGGSENENAKIIQEFLSANQYPQSNIDQIIFITQNMSFRNELCRRSGEQTNPSQQKQNLELEKMLHVVQDSDRLDAIGAIGVARCFTFAGAKGNPLYDPNVQPRDRLSKEDYMKTEKKQNTAINHFHEKLFKVRDLMKTQSGKKMADQRHEFMKQFVEQFVDEWNSTF